MSLPSNDEPSRRWTARSITGAQGTRSLRKRCHDKLKNIFSYSAMLVPDTFIFRREQGGEARRNAAKLMFQWKQLKKITHTGSMTKCAALHLRALSTRAIDSFHLTCCSTAMTSLHALVFSCSVMLVSRCARRLQ